MNRILMAAACVAALVACGRGSDDEDEVGQATGDVLASADEALEGGGLAMGLPVMNRGELTRKSLMEKALDLAVSPAEAAGRCFASATFTSCNAGVRTRTFNDCTIGTATLNGTVTVTFSDTATCTMNDSAESVTRVADFTLTGPRGGTLQVTAPGGGQKLTRTATGFDYQVLGMSRVATDKNGRKLFDISTKTLSDIGISGQNRANRVLNGGQLEVSHNIKNYKVVLTPTNLTWTAGCNCPTSGSLDGTATGSITGSFNVTMTGCGTADVTHGGQTQSVTLDRCAGLSP